MCLKSLLLILWLCISWSWQPSALSAPGHVMFGGGSSGGGHESYLSVVGGPGDVPDLVRPADMDMPAVEPVPEPVPERAQPSTRGGLRVWVSHYSAPIGAVVASGHYAGFRPGICATYAVRDEGKRIVGAHLPGHGPVVFGTVVLIDGAIRCEVWDTGLGYDDARAWVDVAVASEALAKELGAGWREVKVIE